jgi:hypothetical protein
MRLISFDNKEDSILKRLYTDKSSKWIDELNEEEIVPHVIQLWLLANPKLRIQTRWLDKYTYTLPPKMYLSLAWSIIPKSNMMPFMKYVKKKEESTEFDFIIERIRSQFEMSDNDFKVMRSRLLDNIRNNKEDWFRYYGANKKQWKSNKIDFNKMREDIKPTKVGLEAFS